MANDTATVTMELAGKLQIQKTKNAKLLDALVEISKGQGRYSMDHLQHAANTIEDMIEIANAAIKENSDG